LLIKYRYPKPLSLPTIWKDSEKPRSDEAIAANDADFATLTERLEAFGNRYAACPTINKKVNLVGDDEFWLNLDVDAVTVSANEALQGGKKRKIIVIACTRSS